MSLETYLDILIFSVIPVFLVAVALYCIRIIKGPTIPDMVLAVDALGFDLAAFMCLLALYFKSAFLIGGAIILALWVYALDIFVAKYYLKRELGD